MFFKGCEIFREKFKGFEIFSEKFKGCEIFSEKFKGSENFPVPERIRGVIFFESPELDFAQAPQSVRDRSVLIFYTQNFKREVIAHAFNCLHHISKYYEGGKRTACSLL